MKAIEVYQKTQELREKQDKVPWEVTCCFTQIKVDIVGDQVCFGEDYVSMEKAKKAIMWLADQFGLKVTND